MNIGTYVYMQIHIYAFTSIIFTLLLTAFQLKKKGEEIKSYTSKWLPSVAIKSWLQ